MTNQYTVYTILTGLLEELKNELIDTPGGQPRFTAIFPGEIAWDNCCDGLLGITATENYLSTTFLSDTLSKMPLESSNCKGAWYVVDITVDLLRCAPQLQGNRLSVDQQVLAASSREITADAWTIYNAAICYMQSLKDDYTIVEYSTTNLLFVGPNGGCVGCELILSVALTLG